jgi:hypothetical protein
MILTYGDTVSNPYVSTFLASALGMIIVLMAPLELRKSVTRKGKMLNELKGKKQSGQI